LGYTLIIYESEIHPCKQYIAHAAVLTRLQNFCERQTCRHRIVGFSQTEISHHFDGIFFFYRKTTAVVLRRRPVRHMQHAQGSIDGDARRSTYEPGELMNAAAVQLYSPT